MGYDGVYMCMYIVYMTYRMSSRDTEKRFPEKDLIWSGTQGDLKGTIIDFGECLAERKLMRWFLDALITDCCCGAL